MKMLSGLLTLCILIVCVLFLLHTKITFRPFSVTFENWRFCLELLLVFIGIEILCRDAVIKYRRKLINEIEQFQQEKLK